MKYIAKLIKIEVNRHQNYKKLHEMMESCFRSDRSVLDRVPVLNKVGFIPQYSVSSISSKSSNFTFHHGMIKKILNTILFVVSCATAIQLDAQRVNIDSLKTIIRTAPNDTNKVIAYRMLCGTLSNSDPRAAIPYGWKGAELGKKIKWDKGVAGSYLNLGSSYLNLGVFDTALIVTDSALIYALKAGDPNRIALVYINRAAVHINMSNLEKAMQDALKALPYAESSGNKDRIARVYMTMGNISFYQEHWEKAIEYYNSCLPLFQEAGVRNMVGTCYMNIATGYKNLNQLDTAVRSIARAITIFKDSEDNDRLILAYSNSGEIYVRLQKNAEADSFFHLAINLAKQIGDQEQVIFNEHSLGDLYFIEKKYDAALEILLPALDSARKYQFYHSINNITKTLSSLYFEKKEFEDAYTYLQEFIVSKDTLDHRRQNEKLLSLQAQFETEQNLKAIALLNSESELQKNKIAKKNLTNYLLAGGIVSILLITFILWNRNRLKSKLKEVQLRSKIASDLHDDIGATLSSIKLYSELAGEQVKSTNPNTVPLIMKISERSKEMIDSMSDIVWMIKPGQDKFSSLEDRMTNFAYEICSAKNIELNLSKDEKLDSVILPMELRRDIYLIFKEAINNASKYSHCKIIEVEIYGERGVFHMSVHDDGIGFDPAASVTSGGKAGNGIGNMRQRTERHQGKFELMSAKGSGTTIKIAVAIP